MNADILYMNRCLQLAKLGAGKVAPNPMVGAVLVYNGRVIGEGWHQQYGKAHAEVNCIESVRNEDRHLISNSTMYVSLEPCAHHGKTPPCADLVIKEQIPRVVVGCRDPFPAVDGKGIEKLLAAGIRVDVSEIEEECKKINKAFFHFHTVHRPYVILKWAQTMDGFIGSNSTSRLLISNAFTNRKVHQWRAEAAAILVGTQTALHDNPTLTTRLWSGRNPLRIVIDGELKLPQHLRLFADGMPTLVFNYRKNTVKESGSIAFEKEPVQYHRVRADELLTQVMKALYRWNIQTVLVEGGSKTLQSFIAAGLWDEARVITNTGMFAEGGIKAPLLASAALAHQETLFADQLQFFRQRNK